MIDSNGQQLKVGDLAAMLTPTIYADIMMVVRILKTPTNFEHTVFASVVEIRDEDCARLFKVGETIQPSVSQLSLAALEHPEQSHA